ncbi:MAG TPA: hypothetical protein VFE60_03150 [Roseiarcus sp.]|jgi:hypothetical protein|nr:hypothetical protein [Roseiarcus sp.]
MVRIAITQAAFDAIAATMQLGNVGFENATNERCERLIWLDHAVVGQSSIPSLGDGVMLGTAWIDGRSIRGAALPLPRPFRAAWKCNHAQANDRHSSRVFAMPPRGFAPTTRNG